MASSHLRLQIDGVRADVVLDRPEVHNALNPEVLDSLTATFRDLARRADVRYVVLAGAGPSFCAGADLNWMRSYLGASEAENRADAARLVAALDAIAECPKPVIASVHGAALAGGAGLVAAADLAVATPTTTFGLTEVRLGLVPAMIFPFLQQRMALPHLRWAALTGERFPAQRALEVGLINEVAEDPAAVVDRWAASLLAGGPEAVAGVKGLFRTLALLPPDEARAQAIALSARVRVGAEAQEGMRAFLERRKPSWTS